MNRLVSLSRPAGLWCFFTEAGEPAREPALLPATRPDLACVIAVACRHDVTIHGPGGL